MLKRFFEALPEYLMIAGFTALFLLWCRVLQPVLTPVLTTMVVLVWGMHIARHDRWNKILTLASVAFYVFGWFAFARLGAAPTWTATLLSLGLWFAATARCIPVSQKIAQPVT